MDVKVPLQVEQPGTALTQSSSLSLSLFFIHPINASGAMYKFLSCRLDESKARGHIDFVGLGFFLVFFKVFWYSLWEEKTG